MLEWGANEVVQVRLTVNRAPTGLQLTGTAQVGATLTADISGLTDADGLPSDPADYNYQWIRVDGSTETDISGATGQEYSPVVADQTKRVTVRVSYDGDAYFSNEITSAMSAQVASSSGNLPLVFSDGATTTRSLAENTAGGQNVGAAIAATDPNSGDTLTYSLSGTDAFAIDSATGQISTVATATYDHETTPSYSVTVSVSDGEGGTDSITVTITVTNVNETPVITQGGILLQLRRGRHRRPRRLRRAGRGGLHDQVVAERRRRWGL